MAECYNVDFKVIKRIHDYYHNNFVPLLKEIYLAHVAKTVENVWARKHKIVCKVDYVGIDTDKARASVGKIIKGNNMVVFRLRYPKNLKDEYKKRNLIAHELGHILLLAYKYNLEDDFSIDVKNYSEPLSTVVGKFAVAERCCFYKNSMNRFTYNCFTEY